jgi:hypothetical protein
MSQDGSRSRVAIGHSCRGHRRELRAVGNSELGEDVREVDLHGSSHLRRGRRRSPSKTVFEVELDPAPARCQLPTGKAVANGRGTWEAAWDRKEAPISLRAEVVVVRDSELHRRQVRAIRNFLLALATSVGDAATSDAGVGAETPGGDDLEGLMGPLEADVVPQSASCAFSVSA